MKSKHEYYFSIYNLINIKITYLKNNLFKSYLLNTLDYFKSDKFSPDKTNLHIIISDFKPDLNECIKMDDGYYAKKDFLFFTEKYKIASFKTAILNLKGPLTKIFISGNLASQLVWPSTVVIPIIKYLLAKKGFCFLHAAGISNNKNALIFAGRSGTGKSRTLFKALTRNYKMFGDDVCLIGSNTARALPFPLHIRYTYKLDDFILKKLNLNTKIVMTFKKIISKITFGYISLFTRILPHKTFPDSISKKCDDLKIFLMIPGQKIAKLDTPPSFIKKQLIINNLFEESDLDKYIGYLNYSYPQQMLPYQSELVKKIINSINDSKFSSLSIPSKYTKEIEEKLFNIVESELLDD